MTTAHSWQLGRDHAPRQHLCRSWIELMLSNKKGTLKRNRPAPVKVNQILHGATLGVVCSLDKGLRWSYDIPMAPNGTIADCITG